MQENEQHHYKYPEPILIPQRKRKKHLIIGFSCGVLAIALVFTFLFLSTKKANYIISFDTNTLAIVENQTIVEGERVERPVDPKRDGYIFTGWYLGTKKFDFSELVKDNITLVAHWTKINKSVEKKVETTNVVLKEGDTYTIKLDEDGATFSSSDNSIATVSNLGVIRAIKSGNTIITIKKGNDTSQLINLIVTEKPKQEVVVQPSPTNNNNNNNTNSNNNNNPQPAPQPVEPTPVPVIPDVYRVNYIPADDFLGGYYFEIYKNDTLVSGDLLTASDVVAAAAGEKINGADRDYVVKVRVDGEIYNIG